MRLKHLKKLNLAIDLSLPVDLAGQTTAIFGIRGSGKTNTAGVLAEELLAIGHPIAVLDPTDCWWGLRAARDNKPGFPVFIFGGSHADIPLQESDGKVIAEFIVREQVPVILSLRHLRKAAQRRFVTEFCEELYHLKGKDTNRTPLTVFIDEAPLFVPQKVMGEVARTVGAVEDLIARGRNAGFGVVLISQRSATLNADVRTQADTIICHRVTAPLDRKAISDWFEDNATADDLRGILTSLATLKNGEAWIWAPALGIMSRAHVRLRYTFDSSATPKPGQTIRAPRQLADIDIEKLKGKLAETIEQAKADDPRELKKQIADLTEKLERAKVAEPKPDASAVDAAFEKGAISVKKSLASAITKYEKRFVAAIQEAIAKSFGEFEPPGMPEIDGLAGEVIAQEKKAINGRDAIAPSARGRATVSSPILQISKNNSSVSSETKLGKAERAILTVLAQFPEGCESGKLALLSGYRYSGGFRNSLSSLRTAGLMIGENTEVMRATDVGVEALGVFEDLPTGDNLRKYWLTHSSLDKASRAVLKVLLDHPSGLTGLEIAPLCDPPYEYSGGFRNALSQLRTAGLIEGKSNTDPMRATKELLDA